MKKIKKIMAILGIVFLAGLYLSTIVFALIGSERSLTLLRASIYLTITVPVFLYAMMLVYRLLSHNSQNNHNESNNPLDDEQN